MNYKIYRTSIFATILGNAMEWFDYALIGYIAPRYLSIYPSEQSAINPLFFIYTVALLGRPMGGLLFGYLGDTLGRRLILILSIALMTTGAIFAVILPSVFSFSLLTPMLLALIMILHNVTAGGETPASVCYLYESFPQKLRPFALSFVTFGFFLGIFFSSIDFAALFWKLKQSEFLDWGWRLPFLLSAVIGLIGLFFRSKLHETPQFQHEKTMHAIIKRPYRELFKNYKSSIILGCGLLTFYIISINTVVIFGPTYLQTYLNKSPDETLTLSVFAMMVGILSTAFAGFLSLKNCSKKIVKLAATMSIFASIPIFSLLQSDSLFLVFFSYCLLTVLSSIYSALIPSLVCSLFPSSVRCSGFSLCNNFPIPLLTAFVPLVLSWLISTKKMMLAPAYLIIISAFVSLISILAMEIREKKLKASPVI
jgi:MFS transporter, MHS family, proline/betaine transporter